MKLMFQVYDALCAMQCFRINGVDADITDFGSKLDESPETADDYSCGNMRFTRKESTPDILSKYGIIQAEYDTLCAMLEDGLSFGSCGLCS